MSLSLGLGLGLTMQRGVAVFDPATLFESGEEGAWYDPSDISTLWQDSARTTPVTSDGDPVGAMDDKSGNGNNALQVTDAKRPTYKTAGGLIWLDFTGATKFLETGSIDFTAGDKMSLFTGLTKTTDLSEIIVELSANVNDNNGTFHLAQIATDDYQVTSKGTLAVTAKGGTSLAPSTDIVTGLMDIAGPSSLLRVDGSQIVEVTTSQGTGNYGNYPLYIGMRAGTSLPFSGKLYGLITRAAASSADEIAQTEAYLAGKSGVTL